MTHLALLRGINVGGKRRVEMKRLAELFGSVGMTRVKTYINSGNVIFDAPQRPEPELAATLEAAIAEESGFDVPVIVLSAPRLAAIAAELPDEWIDGPEAKCDAMFLFPAIDSPELLETLTIKDGIDGVRYVPGALLWRVPRPLVTRSGMMRLVGTDTYAAMTVRNCNTLRKLAALVAEGADSDPGQEPESAPRSGA